MTPPSAKPEPTLEVDPEAPEPQITDDVEAETPGKPALGRRRAAAVELRLASRRGEVEDGEARAGRAARLGLRNGPRARAAQAAVDRGDADQTEPDADGQAGDEGDDLNDQGVVQSANLAQSANLTQSGNLTQPADAVADRDPDMSGALRPDPVSPAPPRAYTALAKTEPAPRTAPQPEPMQGEIVADDDDLDDDRPGGVRRRMNARAEKRAAKAAKNNDAANYVVAPTVAMAQMRPRHYGVLFLFVLMVLVPLSSYGLYLWTKAADQYESNVGFGSRTEEAPSTFDIFGALGGSGSTGSSDMDILFEFIVSQELVAKLDQQLDLKAIYAKATDDPLNRFAEGGTIEDLVDYWKRMVVVNYDSATGLMSLRVFAFDPADAKKIAEAILVESTRIINDLSMTAQVDTTRYSKEALATAEQNLSEARLAVLDYQIRNNVVDPTTAIATQNGVISTLNQQLATAQIDLDMLTGTVGTNDLRIATLNRRIEVIRNRIAEEEAKVGGSSGPDGAGFAKLMQEFERLRVDQEFSQQAYLAALAAYDQALNDANQKTRYLAAYVTPTLAEASTAPNRPMAMVAVALIGFLSWATVVLMYYALRDRR